MAAELLKRLFTSEIQPKLFPGSSFLQRAIIDDAFVNNNSVQLAHSGTIPNVAVDRAAFPATIAARTDAATEYVLEELSTDPTRLQFSEGLTVSYDKRASILDQQAQSLNAKIVNRALYKWAAGASSPRLSTGAARAAGGPAQTLTRLAFTVADIIAIQRRFFEDDVTNELADINGVAVITPRQYADLLAIPQFTDADKYGRSAIPSGVVSRAFGFDFYVRSSVVVSDGANALKAEGAAGAATDKDTAVFYSPSYVRRAKGAITTFYEAGKADYYGDVMSMAVRFGALAARNDNKGVYLLIEA